jgi:hypothetical protein
MARSLRAALAWLGAVSCLAQPSRSQKLLDTYGKTPAGAVAAVQAARDAASDTLVLLVASHPDDRYVLPATWLRCWHGHRVAVLLATRGGGGQNSAGPETGDALARIRTLEAEAGASHFGGAFWYLDRPDGGYRRSAEETFAEWGREASLRDLARLLRRIRPDVIATTHHREETHGHDLALVELLPAAVALAADVQFESDAPPHRPVALFLGGPGAPAEGEVRVPVDQLEPVRGATLRRLAFDVLLRAHTSPGAPAPIATIFDQELRLAPQFLVGASTPSAPLGVLPSVLDADRWPGSAEARQRVAENLAALTTAPLDAERAQPLARDALAALRGAAAQASGDAVERCRRRILALEQFLAASLGLQVEVGVAPGTVAVAGEEFLATVDLRSATPLSCTLAVTGLDGVQVAAEASDGRDLAEAHAVPRQASVRIRLPLRGERGDDPVLRQGRGDRFQPAARLCCTVTLGALSLPLVVTVPVEERAPVELAAAPRMLLLPTSRRTAQFSVGVQRNSQFPVEGELEVRAPAGYALTGARRQVVLREHRADLFDCSVQVAGPQRPGVDVLRVTLGPNRVQLPVHKIDVQVPGDLRIGIVRSRDDTLPSVVGVGGFGLPWAELSDTDIVAGDLLGYDTIVVDVRALRDRPTARRGLRRLLEFAEQRGHRLVVFYQKDVELQVPGEGTVTGPFAPLQIGKARVTRPDAPVRVLLPQHVLLRQPNAIQPGDWDGWDQERALYLPNLYAAEYEELLDLADPGMPNERGALLYARKGDGEFVYCALALWRQLKKLHPGAVRLLANLLTPRERAAPR